MVREHPGTSSQLLSLENGERPSTNISTVMITTKWCRTVHKYQHSYDHYKMVRVCPHISAQLW